MLKLLAYLNRVVLVKVGGHDSHLPFSLTYHRRFQFTDFLSYPRDNAENAFILMQKI